MIFGNDLSDLDFEPNLSDDATMEVIGREFSDLLFSVEHDLSDLDTDDVHRNDLSDPDDDADLEVSLEQCPFDIDELLDQGF